ncbi:MULTISPECIES: hypothetical protein [unclassified Microcoleus]|uniref:hypothetical protein n=1 Tax=unclassified Microcoleus TaxID=2642155 RepID=UPI002FD58C77
MNDYIDLYCERLVPGLWNEPLNAISNVFFIIAAWAIWQLARPHHKRSPGIWILIALATSIGIASFLFHTFATRGANLLEVIPILLFQLCFIWLYNHRVVSMN